MVKEQQLSGSLEDYLETIHHIKSESGEVRSKEVMERLKVTAASVTEAFHNLQEKGLAVYKPYEPIVLTEKGEQLALDIIHRHETLSNFFVEVLKLDEGIADEGACKMEHVISREIVDRMIKYSEYISKCNVALSEKGFETFESYLKERNGTRN